MDTTSRVLRVTDPASLLAGVPYLLGFAPADDIVVVITAESSRRVALTMRLDLPEPGGPHRDGDVEGTVEALLGPVRRMVGVRAYVVLYPRRDDEVGAPVRPRGHDDLVAALCDGFDAAGADVADVLVVVADRWWSALCREPACCPDEGRPLETPAAWAVRAELVAAGRAPVASRADVEARVAVSPRADDADLGEAAGAQAERLAAGDQDLGAALAAMLDLVGCGEGAASAAPDRLATFYAGLTHVLLRDVVMAELLRAEEQLVGRGEVDPAVRGAAREAFVALTRSAPAGFVAPVATCAAVLAYTSGEGALAWAAWDRAVADDPRYSLAMLLESAMRGGLPPHELRSAFTAVLDVSPAC